jgi:type IV secretion system protein TrbB
MRPLDAYLTPTAIIAVTRMLATVDGQSLHPNAPFLSVTLGGGYRWHSVLPPSADGPSLSIRAHPRLIRSLSDFMTAPQQAIVEKAIAAQKTILISGATSSGKTTCANAAINLIPKSARLVVIEDTPELQFAEGRDVTRCHTTPSASVLMLINSIGLNTYMML